MLPAWIGTSRRRGSVERGTMTLIPLIIVSKSPAFALQWHKLYRTGSEISACQLGLQISDVEVLALSGCLNGTYAHHGAGNMLSMS